MQSKEKKTAINTALIWIQCLKLLLLLFELELHSDTETTTAGITCVLIPEIVAENWDVSFNLIVYAILSSIESISEPIPYKHMCFNSKHNNSDSSIENLLAKQIIHNASKNEKKKTNVNRRKRLRHLYYLLQHGSTEQKDFIFHVHLLCVLEVDFIFSLFYFLVKFHFPSKREISETHTNSILY